METIFIPKKKNGYLDFQTFGFSEKQLATTGIGIVINVVIVVIVVIVIATSKHHCEEARQLATTDLQIFRFLDFRISNQLFYYQLSTTIIDLVIDVVVIVVIVVIVIATSKHHCEETRQSNPSAYFLAPFYLSTTR